MKKIISFLLLAALLVSCMIPAISVSAADAALAIESVEKMQGTGSEVSLELSIKNNPGIYSLSLVVYYNKAELAKGSSDAFAGTLAGADSAANGEVIANHTSVKNFIPEDARAASKAFTMDIYGNFNDDLGDYEAITADGVLANIPLNILASDFGEFSCNVVVKEAYDAEGNEIALNNVSATISYVADPLIGVYSDFTVFANPAEANIEKGTNTVSVDVRFDQNPGLWSTRVYIVYPEALTLSNGAADPQAQIVNPLTIYTSPSDMITGIPDLGLTDSRQVQGFQDLMAAKPEIVRDGYHSTTVYFEPASYDAVLAGNGVLCTLTFNVADDVEVGDVLDINIYYGDADFLWAGTDDVTGEPLFVKHEPAVVGANLTVVCTHETTSTDHKDATCGEDGYDKVVCDACGATVSETVIPATGVHTPGETRRNEPTCDEDGSIATYCVYCEAQIGDVEVIPATGHTPGEPEVKNPKCEEDGYTVVNCSVCGDELSREVKPATGHSFLQPGATIVTPPTCTTGGYTTQYCDHCDYEGIIDPQDPWGHDEDGEVDIVDSTCCTEGTKTIYCATCGEVSKVETIPVKTTHNLEYVAAVEPGCHQTGHTEFWFCVDCEAVYTDAEGTQLSNRKNVTIPALNELAYVPAAEACHVDGTQEYWFCPECEAVFADAAATILTNRMNLTIPADCELAYVPAADACHVAGTQEYWYCPECDAVFADAEGTIRTNRMNLKVEADTELAYVPAANACHVAGCAEYWYCPDCEAVYADEAGTQLTNRKNLAIAPICELAYVPAAEACHVPGSAEYWYCPVCEAVYSDEAGTKLTNRKNLAIEPDCELVYMEKVEACHANGTYEYWFCPDCEAVYADEAGTILTNRKNLTIPADSEAEHVAAVAPTCTKNGMAEYWYCADCDTFFSDAECKYNVAYLSLTIPAAGHNYVDGVCSVCGDKEAAEDEGTTPPDEDKKPEAPITGDNMMFIIIALSVVLVAAAAIVIIRRKRNAN